MQKPRRTSPRRARKQLDAELERLTVPVGSGQVDEQRGLDQRKSSPEAEAQAERIRRMIEAAYT